LAAADFDCDGDQDLASTGQVFLQESPGRFTSGSTIPISRPLVLGSSLSTDDPICVIVVDLDGDGDQELVSANLNGANLTIFWGGR
jgi:hypothetical protein